MKDSDLGWAFALLLVGFVAVAAWNEAIVFRMVGTLVSMVAILVALTGTVCLVRRFPEILEARKRRRAAAALELEAKVAAARKLLEGLS